MAIGAGASNRQGKAMTAEISREEFAENVEARVRRQVKWETIMQLLEELVEDSDGYEGMLCSPLDDIFAKILDANGWMIVHQDPDGPRWFMTEPCDDCPPWADNECPLSPPGTRWGLVDGHITEFPPGKADHLQVIDGGKPPDQPAS